MTFPVQGAFATNPAYSGTFIPALWSGKLNAKFFASTMLTDVMNTTWEGEIKNHGDTINIRTAPNITILPYAGPTSVLTNQVPVPVITSMQINQGRYFSVLSSDVLRQQADLDLMEMFTTDAAKQMKVSIEDEVFFANFGSSTATTAGVTGVTGSTGGAAPANRGATAGVNTAGYNLGTDLAPVAIANVLATILRMAAVLDEQNVPEEGRYLILSPYDRHLLMQSNLAQAYFTGDQASTIRTGKVGMLDRFEVYVSNLLPRGGAGREIVSSQTALASGAVLTSALARRMMVAGTKHACAYASQITNVETLRNQTDFGDIVRGLNIFGRRTVLPTALTTALVGVV